MLYGDRDGFRGGRLFEFMLGWRKLVVNVFSHFTSVIGTGIASLLSGTRGPRGVVHLVVRRVRSALIRIHATSTGSVTSGGRLAHGVNSVRTRIAS